jgi:carbon storage regulator
MLVLSRKQGQKVCIGNGIEVTVVSISGNRIQLGIDAPVDVRVLRGELTSADQTPKTSPLVIGSKESENAEAMYFV